MLLLSAGAGPRGAAGAADGGGCGAAAGGIGRINQPDVSMAVMVEDSRCSSSDRCATEP